MRAEESVGPAAAEAPTSGASFRVCPERRAGFSAALELARRQLDEARARLSGRAEDETNDIGFVELGLGAAAAGRVANASGLVTCDPGGGGPCQTSSTTNLPQAHPQPAEASPGGDPVGRALAAAAQLRLQGPSEIELRFGADLRYALAQGPDGVEILVRAPPALEAQARADLHAVAQDLRQRGVHLARTAVLPTSSARRNGARPR